MRIKIEIKNKNNFFLLKAKFEKKINKSPKKK